MHYRTVLTCRAIPTLCHRSATCFLTYITMGASVRAAAAENFLLMTVYSAVMPDSPLPAAVSKHDACCCWYGCYQLIFGHLAQLWRIHGKKTMWWRQSWGRHVLGSRPPTFWQCGGSFVHRPPSFYRHADCNGCMLQVANAAYQSL